jgi:fimbrial chaperone protein
MPYLLTVLCFVLSLVTTPARAGNYGVSPLDIRFSPQTRSAVLTVTSEDTKPVTLRLRAMRWTQDSDGRDSYEEANDLVFHPKRIELKPGEKRIVRVGISEAPAAGERAWRLYLEELAPPQEPGGGATRLAVLVNIGVPIFSAAADARSRLAIESPSVARDGTLTLDVSNTGASRARLSRLVLTDGRIITESIASRYVFPGITKRYSIAVPREICRGGKASLRFETDGDSVERDVELPRACG